MSGVPPPPPSRVRPAYLSLRYSLSRLANLASYSLHGAQTKSHIRIMCKPCLHDLIAGMLSQIMTILSVCPSFPFCLGLLLFLHLFLCLPIPPPPFCSWLLFSLCLLRDPLSQLPGSVAGKFMVGAVGDFTLQLQSMGRVDKTKISQLLGINSMDCGLHKINRS